MIEIHNDDCLTMLRGIRSKSVDLVITDPPYDVDNHGGGISKLGHRVAHKQIETISNSFDFIILDELCRVMKKINIYLFCSKNQLVPLINYFTDKKCNWNLLTWHKTNPIPTCNNKYLPDTEYVLFFREKGVKIQGTYDTKKTYFITPINVKDKELYQHPTCKPVDILKNFIVNSSNENDVVLDPFMGSGSTGVACINTHRNFIGIEINAKFYETAKTRLISQKKLYLS
nr:MAG TPA: adenine-specific methyltransferase [Bacteriophage sp.]